MLIFDPGGQFAPIRDKVDHPALLEVLSAAPPGAVIRRPAKRILGDESE